MRPVLPANTVIYDGNCPPCRTLAELLGRRSSGVLTYRAHEDVRSQLPPDASDSIESLMYWTGSELIKGRAAWEQVLTLDPSLAALRWMAERLGLASRAPGILERAGSALRRVCRSCPRPMLR